MVAQAEDQARGRVLVCLAVAALGWFLFRQLSLEWRINPQYSYGWVVPFLAVYLVAERWKDRPARGEKVLLTSVFILLLLALLPVRLIQEANPDWRLASWLAGMIVVGILWLGLFASGGLGLWRHFAFATAFILVAAPWPTPLENFLVQSLMQWVAAIGVEALNWLGIAARQEGNLIRLTGGMLGVDEACSGVRSFQATLMVALFFGELYRLTVARRFALLFLGVFIALAFNLLRAVLLAVAAARHGIGAIERWHDPAGYLVLAITFAALLGLARILRVQISAAGAGGAAQPIRLPWRGAVVVIVWLLLCEVATVAWYRSHEQKERRQTQWSVEWPYQAVKISENVRLVLRFNAGDAAVWNRPDGSQWHLFFFSWKPGRAAANLARSHRPETCLPATGYEFVRDRGLQTNHVNGLDLPIERLEFAKPGQHLHVYYCLWEDRMSSTVDGPLLLTRANRLRAVFEGRRHLGQRVLEVVIAGIELPERADEAFAGELPKWIKLNR